MKYIPLLLLSGCITLLEEAGTVDPGTLIFSSGEALVFEKDSLQIKEMYLKPCSFRYGISEEVEFFMDFLGYGVQVGLKKAFVYPWMVFSIKGTWGRLYTEDVYHYGIVLSSGVKYSSGGFYITGATMGFTKEGHYGKVLGAGWYVRNRKGTGLRIEGGYMKFRIQDAKEDGAFYIGTGMDISVF